MARNQFSVSMGTPGGSRVPVVTIGAPAVTYSQEEAMELAAALLEAVQPAPMVWQGCLEKCAPDWWGTIAGPAEEPTAPPVVFTHPPAPQPGDSGFVNPPKPPLGAPQEPGNIQVRPTPASGPVRDPGGLGVPLTPGPIGTGPGQKPTPASGPVPAVPGDRLGGNGDPT